MTQTGRVGGAGVWTLFQAEVFTIRTTRMLRATLVVLLLVHVPPLAAWGQGATAEATWNSLRPRSGLLACYVLTVFAVLLAGQDYRYRTVSLSWLATPSRHRTLVARLFVTAATAAATTSVIFTAWMLAGAVRLGAKAVRLDAPAELASAYAVTVFAVVGAAVVGACVATIMRSTTGALLCLAGLSVIELVISEIRFVGPATSPLRILAWPTSEGSVESTVAVGVWMLVGAVAAAVTQRRDLPGG